METTRRFPRSLSEAFASERFSAVEHYTAPGLLAALSRLLRRIFH